MPRRHPHVPFVVLLAGMLAMILALLAGTPREVHAQATPTQAARQAVGSAVDRSRVAADRREVEVLGRVFGEITIACDLSRCDDPAFVEQLLDVVALRPGEPYDAALLSAAVGRLAQTMFFGTVETRNHLRPDGAVDVRILTEPAILIRRMRVRSGLALETEVRRRIFLRSGQPWTGSLTLIERQRAAIREYFEGEGFFGGQVVIRPDSVRDGTVDLAIDVDRGSRRTVGNIYVRGHERLAYEEVRDTLLGEFNLLRTFTTRRFDAAQDALLATYREMGRLQARITLDRIRDGAAPNTVDLFVEVREGPPWRIEFEGNSVLSDADLLSALSFWKTGFIDDEELRLAVDQLRTRYETVGRYFVEIGVDQRVDEGVNVIRFTVDEAGVSEVREVSFVGVTAFEPAQLRSALSTSVYDIFQVGGYLQRSALASDIERIRSRYREEGYLEAEVTRVTVVAADGGRALHVAFHVQEGPRMVVRDLEVDLPEGAVRPRFAVRPGRPWSSAGLEDDQTAVTRAWHQRGNVFAELTTECRVAQGEWTTCDAPQRLPECRMRPDRDRREACTSAWRAGLFVEDCVLIRPEPRCGLGEGLRGDQVDVRHRVVAGGTVRFGHIFLRGNFTTRDWVLLDDLPFRTGDPFDLDRLLVGQSNIRSQGIFDSVRVQHMFRRPEDEDENVADLVIQVEENRAQFVDLRTGLEARLPSAGNFLLIFSNEPSYRHGNFLGRGEELRLIGNFDIDILDRGRVSQGEFRGGVQALYIDRRFRLWGSRTEPLEARTSLGYRYDLLAIRPAPQVRALEFETRVRQEFRRVRGLFLELALSFRRLETRDQSNPSFVSDAFDDALVFSLAPRITWDRRDNPLTPRKGTFHQLEVELADDFVGVFGVSRFTRFTTRNSGYLPLGGGLVLAGNVRFGFAVGGVSDGFRDDRVYSLPLAERYALGGITSLRGFDDNVIRPEDALEFGGDAVINTTVELRYPFVRSVGLEGAVFLDTGQLGRSVTDFRLDGFRTSAGMGFRLVLLDLIPVLFDYATILDRRPGENVGRFHFNIGYTF